MEKNIIRIGKVSSINYETGMIQVVYTDKGNEVTTQMPYANFNNEYCMPKIGEQVLTAHLSNSTSRGVVLGTMWNRKNIPEESGKKLYRKELSKTKGAAYMRFDDDNGEYLIRVPVVLLHGIDRTDLEGPEVNIAANIRTSLESPEHKAELGNVVIAGLDKEEIPIEIASNINITMNLAELTALIKKVSLETVEELKITSGDNFIMESHKNMKLSANENIDLSDENFNTTLTAILERLETLDGNTSARK